MSKASENTKKWEEFVNSFLFANYKTLEIWVAKREVANNDAIYNYIKFPKAENGKLLTENFVKNIVNNIEADELLCNLFFGPAYQKETAKIVNNIDDISIIWNLLPILDLMEIDMEDPKERKYLIDLFKWDIYNINGEPIKIEITPEEISRREKIKRILRAMAILQEDPKLSPENRSKEDLELLYTNFDWEHCVYWDQIDTKEFQKSFITKKYNEGRGRFEYFNPIRLEWLSGKV